MDNPFAPSFDNHQRPHPKQVTFEEKSVRLVLDRFGLSNQAPELIRRFHEKWGEPRLTFESFFETFPTFPLLLEAHSFYHIKDRCHPVALIRSFEEMFFLQRYLDVYARAREDAQGRPIGMVFNFGLKGGVVMHNGLFEIGGTEIVHHIHGGNDPYRVKMVRFLSVIDFLACSGWTPETALGALPLTQRPGSSGMMVFPWMVARLGASPALVMLAWIRKVLGSPSVDERRFVRRLDRGVRCVTASEKEIASETELSDSQVKRGLHDLRDEGFIEKRGPGRGVILPLSDALEAGDGIAR